MDIVAASEFLASTTKSTIPSWVAYVMFGLVGAIGAGLAGRIPKVRAAKREWLRLVATLVAGGVLALLAWVVAYYVFNVELP